jgi:hypothetical protein
MSLDSLTTISNRRDFTNTFTSEYDEEQSARTIITPTAGKSLKITGVYISTEGATTIGQKIQLHFATSKDTVATLFPAAVANQSSTIALEDILVQGAVNEVLSLTTNLGDGKNYFIAVNYREE